MKHSEPSTHSEVFLGPRVKPEDDEQGTRPLDMPTLFSGLST
jgi:hypothetical protein